MYCRFCLTSLVFISILSTQAFAQDETRDPGIYTSQDADDAYMYFTDGRVPDALHKAIKDKAERKKSLREMPVKITALTNWRSDSRAYAYGLYCPDDGYLYDETCFWRVWRSQLPKKKYQYWRAKKVDFNSAAERLNANPDAGNIDLETEAGIVLMGLNDPLEYFMREAKVEVLDSRRCSGVLAGLYELNQSQSTSLRIYGLRDPEASDDNEISMTLHDTTYAVEMKLNLDTDLLGSKGQITMRGKSQSAAKKVAFTLLDSLEKCRWTRD